MNRRAFFILLFILFVGGVAWYASAHVDIPEYSFAKAATIEDTKKKVIVTGTVAAKDVQPDGKSLTFYMVDAEGKESKIFYDGQEEIAAQEIEEVKQSGGRISVAGHVCGDRFHTSSITIR